MFSILKLELKLKSAAACVLFESALPARCEDVLLLMIFMIAGPPSLAFLLWAPTAFSALSSEML